MGFIIDDDLLYLLTSTYLYSHTLIFSEELSCIVETHPADLGMHSLRKKPNANSQGTSLRQTNVTTNHPMSSARHPPCSRNLSQHPEKISSISEPCCVITSSLPSKCVSSLKPCLPQANPEASSSDILSSSSKTLSNGEKFPHTSINSRLLSTATSSNPDKPQPVKPAKSTSLLCSNSDLFPLPGKYGVHSEVTSFPASSKCGPPARASLNKSKSLF